MGSSCIPVALLPYLGEFAGFLGTAFTPVKHDIAGNVSKVKIKYESNKSQCQSVQQLVEFDLKEHGGKMGIATEGLLWLKRSVLFSHTTLYTYMQNELSGGLWLILYS